ncbi:MAG: GlgB N-terminal domain-containing protein, partial [Myxococcales bacterium]
MIAREELDRIAAVDHPDPHSVLGPHEEDGALVVRAFRPDALGVRLLLDDGSALPMERVHGVGIFEARLPASAGEAARLRYRLEVRSGDGTRVLHDPYAFAPGLGELDLHLAAEGTHQEIHRRLGAHVREVDGVRGTGFAVWAPAAQRVSVTGDFTGWDGRVTAMRRMGHGIWEIFVPGVLEGALYKYEIKTLQGPIVLKSDPYGQAMELRPKTASKVFTRRYEFTDAAWMAERAASSPRTRPVSIYEVHLGSWRIKPAPQPQEGQAPTGDPAERWYGYRELADLLAANLDMPVAEKQAVLEATDLVERLKLVLDLLGRRRELHRLSDKIDTAVRDEMSRSQREYFLRKQLEQIEKELGDKENPEDAIEALTERLEALKLPDEVKKQVDKELARL